MHHQGWLEYGTLSITISLFLRDSPINIPWNIISWYSDTLGNVIIEKLSE